MSERRSVDELTHAQSPVEEWLITVWTSDADLGLIHGFRRYPVERRGWVWSALARRSQSLIHVGEWEVPLRAQPLLAKAPQLWSEWVCDAPFEQWTIGLETMAAALERPEDALGRAYGVPTPLAWDLEWYALEAADSIDDGYVQLGVVHGTVELVEGPITLVEAPSRRWHRWATDLLPVVLPEASAHVGLRAPFLFPDGSTSDWVLKGDGWNARRELTHAVQAAP